MTTLDRGIRAAIAIDFVKHVPPRSRLATVVASSRASGRSSAPASRVKRMATLNGSKRVESHAKPCSA
jgi:hypothetical protein